MTVKRARAVTVERARRVRGGHPSRDRKVDETMPGARMRRRKQAREARLAQDQVGAITVRERDALARPVRARARAPTAPG